jgi:signal transduction histidine kinase
MVIDNFLLAFNGLGILWLLAGALGLFFLFKFRDEKRYWWLLVLCFFFSAGPFVLLVTNYQYPLNSESVLPHLIIVLIICSLISLYFHTLDLLSVRVSKTQIACFFGFALLLAFPRELLYGDFKQNSTVIRTILFHSSAIILLCLSINNFRRIYKRVGSLQVKLMMFLLATIAALFSYRIIYGLFNPQFLVISPHENVDFVFFLIRLLMVILAGVTLVLLISIQKYHLIKINPLNKFANIDEYDVSAVLEERDGLIESLIKTNKTLAVGAISTSLAHELNQPLSSLKINLALLKREIEAKSSTSPIGASTLKDIDLSIERASNIVSAVSNLSSHDQGSERHKSSVKSVVEDIIRIMNHNLRNHQIQIHYEIEDCDVAIKKTELEQVVLNITSNAMNALNKLNGISNTVITFEVKPTQDRNCIISISNNGGIIPRPAADNLFQVLASSTNNGLGIGLWLSRYIMEKNSSQIMYEAIEPDISRFTLKIPLFQGAKSS